MKSADQFGNLSALGENEEEDEEMPPPSATYYSKSSLLRVVGIWIALMFLVVYGLFNNMIASVKIEIVMKDTPHNLLVPAANDVVAADYKPSLRQEEPSFKNKQQQQLRRPFPRWDDQGIDMNIFLQYIDSVLVNASTAVHGAISHRNTFPETLYIVSHDGVRVSTTLRNRGKRIFLRGRVMPSEANMMRAWRKLLYATNTTTRWKRLREVVFEQGTGFPFVAYFGDYRGCNGHNWPRTNLSFHVPIFTVCAHVNCSHAFPMPTYKSLTTAKASSDEWTPVLDNYKAMYPWHSKIDKVVWRGGLTGDVRDASTFRHRLGVFAAQHQHHPLLDLGIVSIPDRAGHEQVNITEFGGLVEPIVPMSNFQRYKAILDIDGNSWSSRFGTLLCYNSVVLKVAPDRVDHFFVNQLQPWKHYVPVQADLSDLLDMAEYVTSHDMQHIVHNANEWCRTRLVHDALDEDLLDIWEYYVQALDRHRPTKNWSRVWNARKHGFFNTAYELRKLYRFDYKK